MKVHLVDGTYELFRAYYGVPKQTSPAGQEVAATIGILRTLSYLLRDLEVTHVACAFDHVIESFRNDLFEGYKTSEGIEPELFAQFDLAERATRALGLVTWPMIEFEADDAIATAAARFKDAPGVDQVVIASPDKDLTQCVAGERVVCWDRRREIVLDEKGVEEKFGVLPESIPDYLALVGDSADGIPGVPGWGRKLAATLLRRYRHIDAIPPSPTDWGALRVRGAERLAANLRERREDADLYRILATLRTDVPLRQDLSDLRWRGVNDTELKALAADLGEDVPVPLGPDSR